MHRILYGLVFLLANFTCLNASGKCVTTFADLQNAINEAVDANHPTTICIKGELFGLVTVPAMKFPLTLIGKEGTGATLNGQQLGTTLTVNWGATVEIRDLTITNGKSLSRNNGGGIYNLGNMSIQNCVVSNSNNQIQSGYGGGIYNNNIMTIEDSTITNNTSKYYGGGIYNYATMEIIHSTISYNSVVSTDQNNYSYGGGIFNDGELKVVDSIIENNSSLKPSNLNGAGNAAGMYTEGHAFVRNCVIRGNIAHDNCGGIENDVFLTIENCSIHDNIAQNGQGGGVYNDYGILNIIDSTIKDNIAQNSNGGGVSNNWIMTIKDSCIRDNSVNGESRKGGGIYNNWRLVVERTCIKDNNALLGHGGGIYNDGQNRATGSITLEDVLVKGNTAVFGGGIANENDALLLIVDSQVTKNTATSGPGGGGGIYNPSPSLLTLEKSKVNHNTPDNIIPPL